MLPAKISPFPEAEVDLSSVTQADVPGGWTHRSLQIAGRTFEIVLPLEPDAFLEKLSTLPVQQHDDHDVYWAQLWQAAPPTAQCILARAWSPGMEALEFGCGLGIAGLAALAVGMQVTFSDYVPFAVQVAVENARRNGFTSARGEVVDWRYPPDRQWPFLLACDVLYNRDMHETLITFIGRVLATHGECWIGDAGRFHAANFLRLAREAGFHVELSDERGAPLTDTHHGKFQLFRLKRKS